MTREQPKRSLFSRLLRLATLLGVVLVGATLSSYGTFYFASDQQTCMKCHIQRQEADRWAGLAHASIGCRECHDSAMDAAGHSWAFSLDRAMRPDAGPPAIDHDTPERKLLAMNRACADCHQAEYEQWQQSGHGVTYRDIFLNEQHNQAEQINDRCLVCHAMFFAGKAADLVTPLNTKGPWQLRDPEMADWPVIPCLACHQVHADHFPAANPDYADPQVQAAKPPEKLSTLSFFVRAEQRYLALSDLSEIAISEDGKPVRIASDVRQRQCYQCHAPNAFHAVGTSDDRTVTGVHEGLSCLDCHSPHGGTIADSCAGCHKPQTEERLRAEARTGAETKVHQ